MKGSTLLATGMVIGLLMAAVLVASWLAASVIRPGPALPTPIAGAADVTIRLSDEYLGREVNRRLAGIATATVTSAPGGQMSVDLRVTKQIASLDLSAGIKSLTRVALDGGRITVELIQLELGGLHLDPERLPDAVAAALQGASAALAEQLNAEVDRSNFVITGVQTYQTGVTLLLRATE